MQRHRDDAGDEPDGEHDQPARIQSDGCLMSMRDGDHQVRERIGSAT